MNQIYIDKKYRDVLRDTHTAIENANTSEEFNLNVGKLLGLTHWIANMVLEEERDVAQLSKHF